MSKKKYVSRKDGPWLARFAELTREYVTKKQEKKDIQEAGKVQKRSRKQSRKDAGT